MSGIISYLGSFFFSKANESDDKVDNDSPISIQTSDQEQISVPELVKQRICAQCSQPAESLKLCSRCREVCYCGPECQKLAWKTHQSNCKPKVTEKNDAVRLDKTVTKFQDESGKLHDLTQKEFYEWTGSYYCPTPIFPEQDFLRLRSEIKDAPTFKKTVEDKVALRKEGEMGYGLVATDDIPSGSCIHFGGKYFKNREDIQRTMSYKGLVYSYCEDGINGFDPSEWTGLGSIANDGPPNLQFVTIKNLEGVPIQCFLQAIQDIKKGTRLYLDYGSAHVMKQGKYLLDDEAFKKVKDQIIHKQGEIDFSQNTMMVSYVLATPAVFFRLHLDGTLDPYKTLQVINKNPKYFHSLDPFPDLKGNGNVLLKGLSRMKDKGFEKLLDKMTQNYFISIVKSIAENGIQFRLEDYLSYGELSDRLYEYVNGTTIGSTLLSTDRDIQLKKVSLNVDQFNMDLKKLPVSLQKRILEEIKQYIQLALEYNLKDRIDTLKQVKIS